MTGVVSLASILPWAGRRGGVSVCASRDSCVDPDTTAGSAALPCANVFDDLHRSCLRDGGVLPGRQWWPPVLVRAGGDALMSLPSLGLISHGTSSLPGQRLIEALAAAVATDLQGREMVGQTLLGHVDVQHPDVAEVLRTLPAEGPRVLVPLLLSPGYHVHVDLAEAVTAAATERPNAPMDSTEAAGTIRGADIRLTPTIGPDPRLARVLADRLPALRADDQVVLAAAGSSDDRANAACLEMGEHLAAELGLPVTVGFHAGAGERLHDIVEQKRKRRGRLVLSSYLLAPGYFQDLADRLVVGTDDLLSPPLLTAESGDESRAITGDERSSVVPPLLVDIVRDRMLSVL